MVHEIVIRSGIMKFYGVILLVVADVHRTAAGR
jgi:hypothetical protein